MFSHLDKNWDKLTVKSNYYWFFEYDLAITYDGISMWQKNKGTQRIFLENMIGFCDSFDILIREYNKVFYFHKLSLGMFRLLFLFLSFQPVSVVTVLDRCCGLAQPRRKNAVERTKSSNYEDSALWVSDLRMTTASKGNWVTAWPSVRRRRRPAASPSTARPKRPRHRRRRWRRRRKRRRWRRRWPRVKWSWWSMGPQRLRRRWRQKRRRRR